jgi:hypothetical protein
MNIKIIENGFNFNKIDYLFIGDIEIISETQCHNPTNLGIILLDLTCTIDNVYYTDIQLFVNALK